MAPARPAAARRHLIARPSAVVAAAALGALLVAAPQGGLAANAAGGSQRASAHAGGPPFRTTKPRPAWIAVSVATLWNFPGDNRRIDAPALANPARVGPWTRSLTYLQRFGLHGRVATQALMGTTVVVIGTLRNWRRIRLPSQVGGYFPKGIIGWVPARQLSLSTLPTSGHYAAVTARSAQLHRHDVTRRRSGVRISYGTRLPVSRVTAHRVWVHVPGWRRPAWLGRHEVVVRANGRPPVRPTPRNLIAQAMKFRGLPFLWDGMSSFGFDCSGFAESMYRMLGINLPRDSGDQALGGRPVRRSRLRRGDLVFFSDDGKGATHTAIYAGHGRIIESPHTGARVLTARLKGYNDPEYYGARRYLH